MSAAAQSLDVRCEPLIAGGSSTLADGYAALPGAGASKPPPGARVLVVEANVKLSATLAEQLQADGYHVDHARTAEHARLLVANGPPQLVLLGGLDPSHCMIELLSEIRRCERTQAASTWVPVIVIGAGSHELDLLRAFEAGADDFVAGSAGYLELRARMRALLRRVDRGCSRIKLVEIGPLSIDLQRRTVSMHGMPVTLRRMEFELLLHLATDPERVFPKQELLRVVWGYRSDGSTRTLDSHTSRLRRKLERESGQRWVINVWGVGYRLR